MTFDAEYTLSLDPQVQMVESNTEVLFVHTGTEKVFGVDEVGAEAIRMAIGGKTLGETIDALTKVYAVDKDILENDVLKVVDELCGLGLLCAHLPNEPVSYLRIEY